METQIATQGDFIRACTVSGPQIKCVTENYFSYFSRKKICCGYSKNRHDETVSKEPSRCDGSFEHPKHMFKLMDKKIIAIICGFFLLNWFFAEEHNYLEIFTHDPLKCIMNNSVPYYIYLYGKIHQNTKG